MVDELYKPTSFNPCVVKYGEGLYNPRYVVCAANKMPDGHLLVGARHWDSLMRAQADKLGYKGGDEVQGFIDQYGNFMTREEAAEVVKGNRQKLKLPVDYGLFSENLY